MTIAPSLMTQLAHDVSQGQWSVPVRQFWVQALTASGTVAPTAGLLRSLQRDWSQGQWQAVTASTTARLFPARRRASLRRCARSSSTGTFGPVTRHLLEGV